MAISYSDFLFAPIYIFVLCYALISDFSRLIIPNWCSIVLVATFVPFAAINLPMTEIALHVAVSLLVLTLGFLLYIYAWFGAGDVKLLSAVILWVGVSKAASFALLMAVTGFVMTLALIALRRILHIYPDLRSRTELLRQPINWVEEGAFPYGIAICGTGIAYFPAIFFT